MVIYDSASIYIQSAATLQEKIARIDSVITALEDAALRAAEGDDVSEYSLDDGQTKIRAMRRGAAGIAASLELYERIRQRYINELNGHMVRLVDGKNFTGCL